MSYMTLSSQKNTISERNSLTPPFFYCVRTCTLIRQHYISKYWEDGCMGRPPTSNFGGTVPPRSLPLHRFFACSSSRSHTGSVTGGSRGDKSGHGPHGSCQWSLAPLRGRKSNDSIVNLSKCKDRCRLRIWPPL